MKWLLYIIVPLLFLGATCNKTTSTQKSELMEVKGEIEKTGMTSYQYGTHTLSSDETFYALKSEKVDLSLYEGQTVILIAEKIKGYPVDGGPDFLEVKSIKKE